MKRKKTVAVVLAILFILFVLLAQVFLIAESDHDCCAGDNCPVCRMIFTLEKTLKGSFAVGALLLVLFTTVFAAVKFSRASVCSPRFATLVALKTKISA